ncbi:unnamed protein product [Phytomonas sp. EM1]|nr:unnamed protein product [Phytomonas sp. EM1]|eukprot:CCW64189.1 unnamed protein product [Phytomonas sp. isolate EM1]
MGLQSQPPWLCASSGYADTLSTAFKHLAHSAPDVQGGESVCVEFNSPRLATPHLAERSMRRHRSAAPQHAFSLAGRLVTRASVGEEAEARRFPSFRPLNKSMAHPNWRFQASLQSMRHHRPPYPHLPVLHRATLLVPR